MAHFMVQNQVDRYNILEKADGLSFPTSVTEYFQGYIGQPPFGFPKEIQEAVLKGAPQLTGRPGASLEPINMEAVRTKLSEKHERKISDVDVLSSVMYPQVFDEYMKFRELYGNVSCLPTPVFFTGMLPGEEMRLDMFGREVKVKYIAYSPLLPDGTRDVYFEVMGTTRMVNVVDESAVVRRTANIKATRGDEKQIGAPMPGTIVEYKVKAGDYIIKGQPLLLLAAMKMETVIVAPVGPALVESVPLSPGDMVQTGDLVLHLK
eukprot:gnl/MRDRNA2_/MRDRNA2_193018_c0_seq1.p1 gnl/MRDRNA2_/MRDRNA2_193018_c0~~gnl/MRDRNA2_/MRDRNA2_193018_c0_seq1.p1  ORF type:complete len:263 (+),score=50.05 gnl/MRDRNA2_/MRDRNA2_193018_c0_seq1:165-953(+)